MKYFTESSLKKILFFSVDTLLSLFPKKHRTVPKLIENILIIKPDHLGDMLMLTSIFPSIHNTYSHAKIDIICGEWALPILDNNPYIRNKIIINGFTVNRKNISFFQKILEFLKTFSKAKQALKNKSYDLCLYMRIHKGNMIPIHWFLASSAFSIGYGTRGRGNLLDKEIILKDEKHEIDTFVNLCLHAGVKSPDLTNLHYELFSNDKDQKYINTILAYYDLQPKSFIILHMGSGNPFKQQSKSFWNKILLQYQENIILTGLENEKYLASELMAYGKIIPLFGQLSIQQLYLLMKQAKLILTVESLSAHLAGMTNTPTISYYTYDPVWWKPYNANNVQIEMVTELHEK